MKLIFSLLLASLFSLGIVKAQTQGFPPISPDTAPQKNADCNCCCEDRISIECETNPFTSLKRDTVIGRFSILSNIGFQPLLIREKINSESFRSQAPTYLNWDILEGEGMLLKGWYLGGHFSLAFPLGGNFRLNNHPTFEVKPQPSVNFGLHTSADIYYGKKFKIFVMANGQFSFDRVRIKRRGNPVASQNWETNFLQQQNGETVAFEDMLFAMDNTERSFIPLTQFNLNVQGSLGADILLNPKNGFALRLQAGYQMPVALNSNWRYSYQRNNDDDAPRYSYSVNNVPLNVVQRGV